MSQYTVLMCSDDLHVCRRLGWYLEYNGCQVLRAATGKDLAAAMHSREFDLILAQIDREDLDGLKILQNAKRLQPRARLILLSAAQHMTFPWQVFQQEVDDYLFMGCRPADLWRRVAACLEKLPEKTRNWGAASRLAPLNRGIVKKVHHVCQYLCYTLDSSLSILHSLIHAPEAGLDRQSRLKIQEVSARLEILQEVMQGLQQGISRQGVTRNFLRALQ